MGSWWMALAIIAAVVSRPIEVRLWRAGRLSDRVVTLLLLGRFPVLVTLFAVLSSAPLPLAVFVVAISLVPVVACYPVAIRFVREQAQR